MNDAPPLDGPLLDGASGVEPILDRDESWARISRWFEDARVRRWYGGESHRCTPAQARETYRRRAIGESPVRAAFITHERAPIGYVQFYRVDAPEEYQLPPEHDVSRTWALDLFIGEPELWGRGIGGRIIELLCAHLEHELGAREILIDPRVENARAVRAYGRVGFEVVGRLRAYEEQDGVVHDGLLMRRLASGAAGQNVEK